MIMELSSSDLKMYSSRDSSSSSSLLGLGLGLEQKQEDSSSSSSSSYISNGCIIQHTVTKFDTLAGVAIKYGVEVGDVKRMNGLSSDLQMFGLNSLQIPLPGQTTSQMTPPTHKYSSSVVGPLKLSSSPQRNISSSITSLRDYYALPLTHHKGANAIENTPLGLHRKSKSEANGFSTVPAPNNNGPPASSDKSIEKLLLVRRRKSEVDLNNRTPEDFAPKIATEPEPGTPNMVPLGSKDSSVAQAVSGVRKSSSAPTFLPSETSNTSPTPSSIWPISLLNFTADLQAMSIAAMASPLFDGLPKPTSGRKNKAARD